MILNVMHHPLMHFFSFSFYKLWDFYYFCLQCFFRWVGAQPEITILLFGLLCLKTMNQEVLCTGLWCFKVHTHIHKHTLAHILMHYLNHYTNPGYSKVTPPFYGAYKKPALLFNKGTRPQTEAWDPSTSQTTHRHRQLRACKLVLLGLERSDITQ